MTYKELQVLGKQKFGRTIKECWIADVKRELGMTTRDAYNRKSESEVTQPCPEGPIKNWLIKTLTSK